MPKLAPVVRDLDSIPAQLRDYYARQQDGTYVLDVDVAQHPTVATLQRQNARLAETASEHAVSRAIAEAGANVRLLTPVVMQHVRMQERDGQLVPTVVDGRGQPRIAKRGAHMTVDDLLAEMKEQPDYAGAFGGTGGGAAAGAARGSSGQGGQNAPSGIRSLKDFRSDRDKAAWIDRHGLEAFQKLPTE